MDEAVAELRVSPLCSGLLRALRSLPPISSIVCLGVGQFASSRPARYQLALALLLRDELLPSEAGGDERLHIYDPALSDLELECARLAGCAVRSSNEAGRIALPGRTLYLLLHCPRALYSNVLDANWGPEKLHKVIVLGNSFQALADALDASERTRTVGWCRVTRAASLVTETTLEALASRACSNDFDYAFSNTCLHTFDVAVMPAADDALWSRPFEPAPQPSGEGLLSDDYLTT